MSNALRNNSSDFPKKLLFYIFCDFKVDKVNCLISYHECLFTSLSIMGLATIDPHSHKLLTKLNKIPKFGVNRPNSKQDKANWKCQSWQRSLWPSRRWIQTVSKCLTSEKCKMLVMTLFYSFANYNILFRVQTWL